MVNVVSQRIDHGADIAKEQGHKRSPLWHKIEKDFLAKNPKCGACGATEGLQVHHVIPFHFCIALGRPDLELDERNLIVLCESEENKPEQNHHLLIGHSNDFKSSNLKVREDARKFFGMLKEQIKEDIDWQVEEKNRMKNLSDMNSEEKQALRKLMDDWYPLENK